MNDRGGVRSNVIEVACDESYDGDESGGGTGGALRHAQSIIESDEGEEGSQYGNLRVDGYLSKEKVEHTKDLSAAEGIKDLIDAGDRSLANFGDLIQFLIV